MQIIERRTTTAHPAIEPWMDDTKVTLRLWKGRLCSWPGNVQNWIEKDKSGELSVQHAPVIGHVPCVRLVNGTTAKVMQELPANIRTILGLHNMAVVVRRNDLTPFVRNLL